MSKLITNTIRHTGGSADNITLDNSGRVMIGTTTEGHTSGDNLTIAATDGGPCGITLRSDTDEGARIFFSDGTSGADEYRGVIGYDHGSNYLYLSTDANERLRITSGGHVLIGEEGNDNAFFKAHAADGEASDLYVGQFINAEATAGVNYGVNIQGGSNSTDHGLRVKNHAGTSQLLVRGDGEVQIGSGNLVISTAGKGISFAATSDGTTMSSEVLDDYEEGTWLPVLQGDDSAGTTTYHSTDNRRGHYIKVGRKVTVWLTVGWGAATGTGDIEVHGLPFAVDNTSYTAPNGKVQAFAPAYTVNVSYPSSVNGYCMAYTWGGAGNKMIFAMSRDGTGTAMLQMEDGSNEDSGTTKYIGTTLTYQVA